MQAVWANKPYVSYIGPRNTTRDTGYDAVMKNVTGAFDRFSKIAVEPINMQIQSDGKLAWVIGTEKAELHPKAGGETARFETFVTNVFEKDGDRWLMVLHHAQTVPK